MLFISRFAIRGRFPTIDGHSPKEDRTRDARALLYAIRSSRLTALQHSGATSRLSQQDRHPSLRRLLSPVSLALCARVCRALLHRRHAIWIPLACAASPALATQDPARVQAVAESFLRAQLATLPGRATITVESPQTAKLAACDALAPFLPAGMRPRARMTVGVRCNAPQNWTTYVQASVAVTGTYYVTRQAVPMGHLLSADDLDTRKGDLLALAQQMALRPDQVVGQVANRRLQAGQPIRLDALRSPQAIQRGEAVRLMVQGPGFTAMGTGRAMGNAAPGASLQVRTESGQVVTGTVTDTGIVQINQ